MLLNLIKTQRSNIDRIYLHVKDPFEWKYQFFINGREKVGIKKLKNPKAFIGYLQTIDDVYENFEDYNPAKKKESVNSVWWYNSRYWLNQIKN